MKFWKKTHIGEEVEGPQECDLKSSSHIYSFATISFNRIYNSTSVEVHGATDDFGGIFHSHQ